MIEMLHYKIDIIPVLYISETETTNSNLAYLDVSSKLSDLLPLYALSS